MRCSARSPLGDIGNHFPDDDNRFRSINSRRLLKATHQLIAERGFAVVNLDATLIAQNPRLSPFITKMVENIASDIACQMDCVSVKATTTEKLGFIGHEEGLAAHSIVLLEQQ